MRNYRRRYDNEWDARNCYGKLLLRGIMTARCDYLCGMWHVIWAE